MKIASLTQQFKQDICYWENLLLLLLWKEEFCLNIGQRSIEGWCYKHVKMKSLDATAKRHQTWNKQLQQCTHKSPKKNLGNLKNYNQNPPFFTAKWGKGWSSYIYLFQLSKIIGTDRICRFVGNINSYLQEARCISCWRKTWMADWVCHWVFWCDIYFQQEGLYCCCIAQPFCCSKWLSDFTCANGQWITSGYFHCWHLLFIES